VGYSNLKLLPSSAFTTILIVIVRPPAMDNLNSSLILLRFTLNFGESLLQFSGTINNKTIWNISEKLIWI
jgi:hypothetical protein